MLYGVDVTQRVEFISSQDTSEPKTIFVLRPLGGVESVKIGSDFEALLAAAIVEIKNMPDGISKEAYLNSLDTASLGELVQQCNELSKVTRQEIKN